HISEPWYRSINMQQWAVTIVTIIYGSKLLTLLVILVDDIQINTRRLVRYLRQRKRPQLPGKPITRSAFFDKLAIVAGAVPLASMATGILSGATDYRVIRKTIYLPNLPKSFDGIRIGHFSDTHAGTFFHRIGVRGGVEMLLAEKPRSEEHTSELQSREKL